MHLLQKKSASIITTLNGETNSTNPTSNEYMRSVAQFIIKKVAQYKKGEYSEADEIKKYKELLDTNAITQEEYSAKKKQLLGL